MKAFNLKTNGAVEFTTDTEQYVTDVTDTAFSEDRLEDLLAEIKGEALIELHIEINVQQSFVHKVTSVDVSRSDNVNSYPVFVDLQGYCDELRASSEGE